MKSRSKLVGQRWWSIGLPSVFLLCLFFFLVGLFGSTLISHQDVKVPTVRPRPRVLESVEEFDPLPNGETGEHSLTSIPFQVLSWFPRALYFPNFATVEQCQGIIKMAKAELKPSSLALRKGETAENTKGIRTRHLMCCGMKSARVIIRIMMLSILLNMVLRRAKGLHPSYCIYLMWKKVEKLCSLSSPLVNLQSGQNMDANYDFRKCIGLKVKPRRGDGLLFYSLFPNGTIDPTSLHGSCPVIRGEKWVATKWIRNQEQDE
ncbi:probable prolyl 4-hydroxylase 9 isoform X2 [Lycium ferocissimum]|uniref:probable prolyl 4-hydroxylase 9 isoform X2 n=1 Tax=Lycium ferocissimum TaxID=112874 RepID=UPI002814F032|nr:probable prolyl 4-hydroxylase 9 isoform X2 [Lycium ferocissimum]